MHLKKFLARKLELTDHKDVSPADTYILSYLCATPSKKASGLPIGLPSGFCSTSIHSLLSKRAGGRRQTADKKRAVRVKAEGYGVGGQMNKKR